MIDPHLALQTAVRAHLVADPGVAALIAPGDFVDSTAKLRHFPAIVIGDGQTVGEFATLKRDTSRVYIDLHCWASSDDLASVKRITGAVQAVFDDLTAWSLEGYRVVDAFTQSTRFLRDHEGETPLAHAVLTLNALLQWASV